MDWPDHRSRTWPDRSWIVIQILFGENATFLTGDIVGNLIALIRALGDNGLVGLIALGIILYLYNKSRD